VDGKYKNKKPEVFFEKEDKKINPEKLAINGAHNDLRHISAGKKNAKIAGVEKMISFTRVEPSWFDLKFQDKDTILIHFTKHEATKADEIFRQAYDVLTPKGTLGIISLAGELEQTAKKHKFKIKHERILERGANKLHLLFFTKVL
jgi:ubiquinone/menaquinone biosynthesis C-methylase UbiE